MEPNLATNGFTGRTQLLGIALGVAAIASGISGIMGAPIGVRVAFGAVLIVLAIALGIALWQERRR